MAVNITDPEPSVFVSKGVRGANPLEGVSDIIRSIPDKDDSGAVLNEFELAIQQLESDERVAASFPAEMQAADRHLEAEADLEGGASTEEISIEEGRRQVIGDFDKKLQSLQRLASQTGRSSRERAFILMQQFSSANPSLAIDIQQHFATRFASKGMQLFSNVAEEALAEQQLNKDVAKTWGTTNAETTSLYLEQQRRTQDRLLQVTRAQDNEDKLRRTTSAAVLGELNSSFASIYNNAIREGWTEQVQVETFRNTVAARRQQLGVTLDGLIEGGHLFSENKSKILEEFDNQASTFIDNLDKEGFAIKAEDYNKARKLWVQGVLNIEDIKDLADLHEFGIQGFVTFLEAMEANPEQSDRLMSMLGQEFSPETLQALEQAGDKTAVTARLKEAWTLALSGACPASYEGTKLCAYFQRQMLHQSKATDTVGEFQVAVVPTDVALQDASSSPNILRGLGVAAEKVPADKNKWHQFASSQSQMMANTNLIPSADTEFRYVAEDDKFVRVIKDNPNRGPLSVGGEIVDDTNLTIRANYIISMYNSNPTAAEHLFRMNKEQFIDRSLGTVFDSLPATQQQNLVAAAQDVVDGMADGSITNDNITVDQIDIVLQSGISIQDSTRKMLEAAKGSRAKNVVRNPDGSLSVVD